MKTNYDYLGYIESDGGLFIISSAVAINNWNGTASNDYDLLCDYISQMTTNELVVEYTQNNRHHYLIFISNSKNLVAFKNGNRLIICEQYYKDKSWDYTEEIVFNVVNETNLTFNNQNDEIIIYDAVLERSELEINNTGVFSSSNNTYFRDYIVTDFKKGNYKMREVVYEKNNIISLKGIEIFLT